jgi:hypothetical protein
LELKQTIPRQLELRSLPSIFVSEIYVTEVGSENPGDVGMRSILSQLYGGVFNSRLYSGLVDLAFNGSRPAWVSDDQWSFAPVDASNLSIPAIQKLGSNSSTPAIAQSDSSVNITLDTPGIRARIECTELDLSNTSNWLTTLDFTNHSNWDVTSLIPGLAIGYSLGEMQDIYFFIDPDPIGERPHENLTNFFTDHAQLICCANMTDDKPGQAAIG